MSQNTKIEGECDRGLFETSPAKSVLGSSLHLMHTSPTLSWAPLCTGWLACVTVTWEGAATLPGSTRYKTPRANEHYSQHCPRFSEEGLPGAKGAHICPCSVNPKQCLVGVTASLRRIWFCHGKGRGFLTSKFCWESDDSKQSAPPPPSYHMGWLELRGHISVGHCGTGWDVMEVF